MAYVDRRKLKQLVTEWKKKSGMGHIRKVMFSYDSKEGLVTVYSSRPGYMIGKAGCHINEYTEKMKVLGVKEVKIKEVEDGVI